MGTVWVTPSPESITIPEQNGQKFVLTELQRGLLTSCSSRGIEGEHCLNGDVHGGSVEGFEHDLSHLFSVGLGVQWGFSQEDWVFLRSNSEFVVEGVVPDLLHIVP